MKKDESLLVGAKRNTRRAPRQAPRLVALRAILENLSETPIAQRFRACRRNPQGRRGYPVRAMWRAYLSSFVLNLPSTNALHRELDNDPRLLRLCGFDPEADLPDRRTFNRFIEKLSEHPDLIEAMHIELTNHLKNRLPGLGDVIAIDSTPVRSHAQPRKDTDPEAGWAVANSPQGTHGKKWVWGAKVHLLADAIHGLPLSLIVTRGNRNDTVEMLPLVVKAKRQYDWFGPTAAVADRGYDSHSNHEGLWFDHGIIPVMRLRGSRGGPPVCEGGERMVYRRQDRQQRRVYSCPDTGCPLKEKLPSGRCSKTHKVDPLADIRRHGVIRRDSERWNLYYNLRKSIERIFKAAKESRRLERHAVRGLRQIKLHALMSFLTFSATALMHVRAGQRDRMRWMVRQVA